MLWSMMVVSTWFLLMMISTMMFFPMKYNATSVKKLNMNKKMIDFYIQESMNCKFMTGQTSWHL